MRQDILWGKKFMEDTKDKTLTEACKGKKEPEDSSKASDQMPGQASATVEVRADRRCCCHDATEGTEGQKQTIRTDENKKKLLNRLRRIEGQVRGLEAMIERDAYCNDILQQSAAVNAAMNSFNRELIANHMKSCVVRDLREGKEEIIDELLATLQKLMK